MTQLTVKTAAALARPLGFTIRRTTPGESELVAYRKGEGVDSDCAYFSDCPLDVLATAASMAENAGADPEAVKAARAACGVPEIAAQPEAVAQIDLTPTWAGMAPAFLRYWKTERPRGKPWPGQN